MEFFLALFWVVVVSFLVYIFISFFYFQVWVPYKSLMRCKKEGIPTFPFRPILGQLVEIQSFLTFVKQDSRAGDDDYKFTKFVRQCVSKYGPIYAFNIGTLTRVQISDPDLVREVLLGSPNVWLKSQLQRQNLRILGNGLVNSNGSFWVKQRKMVNPAFSHRNIKGMVTLMVDSTLAAVKNWRMLSQEPSASFELDIQKEMSVLTLDIIGRSAFGANIGGGSDVARQISANTADNLSASVATFVGGYRIIPGYEFMPTELNRRIWSTEKAIREQMLNLIKSRREAVAKGTVGSDLLASMLAAVDDESNEGMTDSQLIDESVTFLLAGHETTALLLTWTMYLLARNASWQERLRREVKQIVGPTGEVREEHLSSLKDMHNVLLESLRLFPPVTALARITHQDTQLGKYVVPKGVSVLIPISMLHHRKDLWGEDVDEFKPDRFAEGVSKACKAPHCFIPFSSGPRNCIGQSFALTEAKVILSHILHRLSWELSPNYVHSLQMIITLRPLKGMPMIFTPLASSVSE